MRVLYFFSRILSENSDIWEIVGQTSAKHEVTVALMGQAVINLSSDSLMKALSEGVDVCVVGDDPIHVSSKIRQVSVRDFPSLVRGYDRLISV
ncbi:MAG: hypothetical protein QXI37_01760 [Thermoprotei archaeon]